MKVSYTRTIVKDIDIKEIFNKVSDTIYDCVYDEIGTDDFTGEDYNTIQPIIDACAFAIGKELIKNYSATEH